MDNPLILRRLGEAITEQNWFVVVIEMFAKGQTDKFCTPVVNRSMPKPLFAVI